jgi:hypothetical protein
VEAGRSRDVIRFTYLGVEFLDGCVREGGAAHGAAGLGDSLQGLGTCVFGLKSHAISEAKTR